MPTQIHRTPITNKHPSSIPKIPNNKKVCCRTTKQFTTILNKFNRVIDLHELKALYTLAVSHFLFLFHSCIPSQVLCPSSIVRALLLPYQLLCIRLWLIFLFWLIYLVHLGRGDFLRCLWVCECVCAWTGSVFVFCECTCAGGDDVGWGNYELVSPRDQRYFCKLVTPMNLYPPDPSEN